MRLRPEPVRFALPGWVPLPGDAEFDAALRELEAVVDDIVAMRRDDVGSGDDPDAPMDLLSILLRARERGEQTDEQLRDELVTMLLAGHDTTALTLTYAWYLLSEHPDAERRLHEEVDAVLDGDRPGMAHVRELEYTERAIQEAMRLYPPVYTILRTPTRRFEVDGYTVPPGSTVMLPQWAVHRSPRHWDDPEAFDPDRWTPERSRERHRFAYFPFGGGPRHCIGKHLAILEAQLIVATVASRYRLAYVGESPPDRLTLPDRCAHTRHRLSLAGHTENRASSRPHSVETASRYSRSNWFTTG
jgi:cytochrome P450